MPAFFNGVFGHKPSPGTVPNHGQYPEPVTDEQARFLGLGPICRRAEDLLPLLKVIANPKLRLEDPVDIKKLKWFYQETDGGSFFVSPVAQDIRALFGRIVAHLQKAHGVKATKVSYCSIFDACYKSVKEDLLSTMGRISKFFCILQEKIYQLLTKFQLFF